MLELTFTAQDLAYTRFSVSPLWEVVASVQVLKSPAPHPVHHRWVEQVRPRLADLDWRLLSDLVPVPSPRVPGFLAPPQPVPVPDIDLELAALRAVPAAVVRTNLADLWQHRPPAGGAVRSGRQGDLPASLAVLDGDPPRGLALLAEAVQAYWEVALAAYWPRILTLLEGEIFHRARLLAEGGAQRLLNNLDPAISWEAGRLRVAHRSVHGMVRLAGRGLLLAPSAFIWPRVASIVIPPWQPTLRYPPRGVGTLWESRHPEVPEPLARVVGRARARLLTELESPASTAALAGRTGATPGGVSQHLVALRDAGLVSAHRSGRFVLYARTRLAEALLAETLPAEALPAADGA